MEIARDSVANHKRDDIGVTGNTADEKKSSNTFVVSDVTDGDRNVGFELSPRVRFSTFSITL